MSDFELVDVRSSTSARKQRSIASAGVVSSQTSRGSQWDIIDPPSAKNSSTTKAVASVQRVSSSATKTVPSVQRVSSTAAIASEPFVPLVQAKPEKIDPEFLAQQTKFQNRSNTKGVAIVQRVSATATMTVPSVQRVSSTAATASEPPVPLDQANTEEIDPAILAQQTAFQVRQLRELFHFRFNEGESRYLLKKFAGNLMAAVTYVFECEPRSLNNELAEHRNSWEVVTHYRHKGPDSFDTQSNVHDMTNRLFACGRCDSFWWKETLAFKPVGQCFFCQTKYDPVPIDQEWGWAEFNCKTCRYKFNGWCQMQQTTPCYNCWENVSPSRIIAPQVFSDKKSATKRAKKSWMSHHCPTCYGPNCAHPWSRMVKKLPKVIVPSQPHISSGSTILAPSSPRDLDDLSTTFDMLSSSGLSSDFDDTDHSTIDTSSPRSISFKFD